MNAKIIILVLCLSIFGLSSSSCGPQVRKYEDKAVVPVTETSSSRGSNNGAGHNDGSAIPSKQSQIGQTTVKAIVFKTKNGKDARLGVEVVDTPSGIRQGLMYRKSMDKDHGMLFMMPQARYQSFWMKNTYLPLSIAFIGDDMKIINICKMKPLDTGPRYRSKKKCRYALEVNQGWFENNGVKSGDRAIFLSETK